MKLAFAAQFDVRDVHKRSGTPYFMTKNMEEAGIALEYICPLKTELPFSFRAKRFWKQLTCGQHESSRWQIAAAKSYAAQVQQQLDHLQVDGVIGHILSPMAYLDCKQPLFLWTDVLYANHLGFFPGFSRHSASTIQQANTITREFLDRCRLAIFSSEWAARGAIEIYGTDKNKVKVVPYGANIDYKPSLTEMKDIIEKRSTSVTKLLFMGKPWHSKGGDIVFKVAQALHAAGHAVELNIVGCQPPAGTVVPDYIKCHGYVSKRTPAGMEKLLGLLRESHFLFVPTRAEAYGIVFCEANAFGLPCLTTYVGGIPVRDNINGMTFALNAPVSAYCDYIVDIMRDKTRYQQLALSSFNEYETRLNWQVAVKSVRDLIQTAL